MYRDLESMKLRICPLTKRFCEENCMAINTTQKVVKQELVTYYYCTLMGAKP